jgi:CubicO group peptidase (beta-lactamase class C family)
MVTTDHLVDQIGLIAHTSSLAFADVAAGDVNGIRIRVNYSSSVSGSVVGFQKLGDQNSAQSGSDRRYLIASITKPIVGLMAVELAAAGKLSLNQPVREFVDGFQRGPLRTITVRHLLTHTSGLPDMLPNNNELRAQQATLSDFVHHTARVTPDFLPGTNSRYSSMGFAVLATIVEQVTRASAQQVLSERLFAPLSMNSSWLGLPEADAGRLMSTVIPCELPEWQQPESEWNWNSRYWRTLGAPWGGMISTAEDLGRLAMAILRNGLSETGKVILSESGLASSTQNQTKFMSGLSETDRLLRPWGLGWRMNWLDHFSCFSDFLPEAAFGHWGATGTMMWIDRQSARWCVILTNQPYERSQTVIQKMSNLVAASV